MWNPSHGTLAAYSFEFYIVGTYTVFWRSKRTRKPLKLTFSMPFSIFLKQSDAAPFSYFILRRNGLDPHPTQFANFYGKGATGLRIFSHRDYDRPSPRRSQSAFCVCRRTAEHQHVQSAIDLSLKIGDLFLILNVQFRVLIFVSRNPRVHIASFIWLFVI